ncbi:MAG: hypothetical protein ABL925_10280 [Methylococcales bacterium]
MKNFKRVSWLILLISLISSGLALARDHRGGGGYGRYDGGHWRGGHRHGFSGFYGGFYGPGFGFYSGPGFGYNAWSRPYYQPYYAYPPVITVQPSAPPPIYIERDPVPVAPPPPSNYWYYCRNPEGYYPYVKQCQGNWEQVAPQPPER